MLIYFVSLLKVKILFKLCWTLLCDWDRIDVEEHCKKENTYTFLKCKIIINKITIIVIKDMKYWYIL